MHLLFDLDGTLTDPFEGITRSIVYAMACVGKPSPDPAGLGWCIGPSLRASLARLLETEDNRLVETALAKYRERFGSKGLFENEVYAGIPQNLQALHALGHNLYIATAKPVFYARKIIAHFGLGPFFRGVYGSELDGTRGNKADLIAYILQREAFRPQDAVMIGDHAHDMLAARHNQIAAIGVLWGYGSRNELEAAGALCTIASPQDLGPAVQAVLQRQT